MEIKDWFTLGRVVRVCIIAQRKDDRDFYLISHIVRGTSKKSLGEGNIWCLHFEDAVEGCLTDG